MSELLTDIRHETARSWKLATLAIGLGLLIAGAYLTPAPDWDIGVSIVMAGFTYLFAGWSMRMIIERRCRDWPLTVFLTWWCVDGCYALYWSVVDPVALDLMREANWPASLSLFWMCGLVWYWRGSLKDLLAQAKQHLSSRL